MSEEAAVVTLEERLRRLNEEKEERMSAVQILEEKLKQIQDNEDQYVLTLPLHIVQLSSVVPF